MTATLLDPVAVARDVAATVTNPVTGAGSSTPTDRATTVADAVRALKASGLLAATVPARLGGPELTPSQIAEVVRILAAADGSLAQIPQSHFTFSRWLFDGEHPDTEEFWADRLLAGTLIANAQAEHEPLLFDGSAGRASLTGRKIFCTGSPFADVLAVTARRPGEEQQTIAVFLDAATPGVRVIDDWDNGHDRTALGQRFTGSGTVTFTDVTAPVERIYTFVRALSLPGYGAFAQLLHAAIDVGLADGALDSALTAAVSVTTPGVTGTPDDLTAHLAGELSAQRFTAAAVLEKAGRTLDALWATPAPDEDQRVDAALQVAAAKVTTGTLTVDLASRVFELTGTRGARVHGGSGLDRHWRDLRTHTLHERRRDKLAVLGRATLTGKHPELGPQF